MAKKVVKKGNCYLYVYIPKAQKLAFEKIAQEKGTTLSALMRNVLEAYIERQEIKVL